MGYYLKKKVELLKMDLSPAPKYTTFPQLSRGALNLTKESHVNCDTKENEILYGKSRKYVQSKKRQQRFVT